MKDSNRPTIEQFRAGGRLVPQPRRRPGRHGRGQRRHVRRHAPLQGDERDTVWALLKTTYPFFAEHETKTGRVIPVVALKA